LTLEVRRDGEIEILRLNNPPVNALSIQAGVVAALGEAFNAAMSDPAVKAVVIAGSGRMFSGGADIKDFDGDPAKLGAYRVLLNRIEQAPKPVIAAIHGMALGGGLELALAAHYRISAPGARLGLPEVKLGVLPGAGGTQRLPRILGCARAIELMVSGAPISSETAAAEGLIDQLAQTDVVDAALAFARENAALAPRPTGLRAMPPGGEAAIAAARAKLNPKALNKAPAFIIDCVEKALEGDIAAGLAFEAERFASLMTSQASRGLRHAFFGERAVSNIPGLAAETKPAPIGSVAVIGAGTMGTGITIAMINADLPAVLIEARPEALERALAKIEETLQRDVAKGRLAEPKAKARLAALKGSTQLQDAGGADLVIEAVFENIAVKQEIFTTLDRIAKPSAILASNTSFLDLDQIAGFTSRPEQVVGLHFFSPANIMRLLEIVRGEKTSPQVLTTALALSKRIGKIGVVAGVCDGFIGNRMFEEYLRQAGFLAEEGASPQQIDAAIEAWGWAMGPFKTLDLAGQDVGHAVRTRRVKEYPDRPYSTFLDRVVAMGRLGQKTGKGVYSYPDGRKPQVDPEIDALLLEHSRREGIERRAISDEEIVERCMLPLINEGARLIEEGIAYRPVDIDIIYLNGYGFPAERGGPMFYADKIGPRELVNRLHKLSEGRQGWAYKPAALLEDLAARSETFGSLNERKQ
jgi:3-hydroxyacyl-CoA dehydrogenase